MLVIVLLGAILIVAARPAWLLKRYFLTACAEEGPVPMVDFDQYVPPYDRGQHARQLADLGAMQVAAISHAGESYSVWGLTVGDGPIPVLVLAGIHGNERATALAVPEIIDELRGRDDLLELVRVRIVSPVNPVGTAMGSRYQSLGCDPNRDFSDVRTPETSLVLQEIASFQPIAIVSLHEGPQDGFFIIADPPASAKVAAAAATEVARAGIALSTRSFLSLPLGQPGVWAPGWLVTSLKSWIGLGSLGTWGTENDVAVYTTESPWGSTNVEARRRSHAIAVIEFAARLGGDTDGAAALSGSGS